MTFTLPLPPSINATYRMGKGNFYKASTVKAWEAEAAWVMKTQLTWHGPLTGPVVVLITWYLKRDRDVDAGMKVVLDLLQSQRVIENDNQVVMAPPVKLHDTQPRCVLQVFPLHHPDTVDQCLKWMRHSLEVAA